MSDDHKENIEREFQRMEGETKKTNLGKVDIAVPAGGVRRDDPEVQRLNDIVGYHNLPLEDLPSKGRFYRDDFRISIRSASTKEIREWSTLDENNIRDIDEKLNSILTSCVKIQFGAQRGSYKDFLEEDRLYVILRIKELTYKDGENKLMMPVKGRNCPTSTCKSQTAEELRTDNIQFQDEHETIGKYYDFENRCYSVQTKNHGTITLSPPNIGVMRAVTTYIGERESDGLGWDKSTLMMLPYMIREWRGLTAKEIFSAVTQLEGLNRDKFNLMYRLIEMIKVGIKPEFEYKCKDCGAEVTVPLTFPGGIKALFVVSDISSELL